MLPATLPHPQRSPVIPANGGTPGSGVAGNRAMWFFAAPSWAPGLVNSLKQVSIAVASYVGGRPSTRLNFLNIRGTHR